nr:MAG TPA: hypothetical protein [Microviridae sp.]
MVSVGTVTSRGQLFPHPRRKFAKRKDRQNGGL